MIISHFFAIIFEFKRLKEVGKETLINLSRIFVFLKINNDKICIVIITTIVTA